MRKLFTILALGAALGQAYAQPGDYYHIAKNGVSDSYLFTNGTGITTVLAAGTNNRLSTAVNLPFAFNFYGKPVTAYKASDNGYITFDVSETVSMASNTSLPDANAPKNAIFAMWDDLEVKAISGSTIPTQIRRWTYGTAPNRVHVIQWYTASQAGSAAGNSNFLYFAIRLKEAGGFDMVYNYGWLNGGSLSGTIGLQNEDGSKGYMIGTATQNFPKIVGNYVPGSDLVYEFLPGTQPVSDLSILSLNMADNMNASQQITVAGQIANYGSAAVTNYTLNYSVNNGTPVSHNYTAVNYASNGTYSYSHPVKISGLAKGQMHTIKVWASNINGNVDEVPGNDEQTRIVMANEGLTTKRNVLLEEGSGAWCGFCTDGHLNMKNLLEQYKQPNLIPVMHHNGDAMVNPQSDSINSYFSNGGYPFGTVDRYKFEDQAAVGLARNVWTEKIAERANMPSPVMVKIENRTYDEATRKITFDVVVTAADDYNLGSDIRMTAMITENDLRGANSTGYNQTNYYSGTGNAVGGASHPFFNESPRIVGYKHQHAVRRVLTPSRGLAGVVPSVMTKGQQVRRSFSYTVGNEVMVDYGIANPTSSDWHNTNPGVGQNNWQNMEVVAVVSKWSATNTADREVLNAHSVPVYGWHTDLNTPANQATISATLYPNPTTGLTTVTFNTPVSGFGTVQIIDIAGHVVRTVRTGNFAAGEQATSFDVSDLNNGIYMLNVNVAGANQVIKFVVSK